MVFIGWVRFDSFPDYRINSMYPLVMGTLHPKDDEHSKHGGATIQSYTKET